jgi:hypothetical protein
VVACAERLTMFRVGAPDMDLFSGDFQSNAAWACLEGIDEKQLR